MGVKDKIVYGFKDEFGQLNNSYRSNGGSNEHISSIKVNNYSSLETISSVEFSEKFYKSSVVKYVTSKKSTDCMRVGSLSSVNVSRKGEIDYLSRLNGGSMFPNVLFMKHHMLQIFQRKFKTSQKHIAAKRASRYFGRHFTTKFNTNLVKFNSTTSSSFFENWNIKKKYSFNRSIIFKLLWKYFKLKIERFFFKMIGMRTHVWFLSIWQIFVGALPSRNSWDYFEAKKIIEYTRRGHRYVIETPEDAKFFIRIMVIMFSFLGGIRLFLEKVSDWMANFRNHWAYVRFIAETMRKCSNFFWFRFFLNYRISLQGKIGGQLRAQKKIFNRGTISIEDKSSTIGFHKCYSNTKFGIFNLSMWIQFKVPTVTESFEGHELISTMRILLNKYDIPWLGDRLANVVSSIDSDEKKRNSYKKGGKLKKIKKII